MHCHYDESKNEKRKLITSTPIVPRGLSTKQAATFYGISLSRFYKGRREGKIPAPTLPGKRYDLRLLERAMNTQSGIASDENCSPLEEWKANRARSTQRH
jgi:hypothetical protein